MLHVASYNIRKSVGLDWQRDPRRILAVIHEIGADIVALQEVDRRFGSRSASLTPQIVAEESDYELVRLAERPASVGWHGNAFLVRRHVAVTATRGLALPALEPRGAAIAEVDVEGRNLRVVGLHLGLLALWRRRQADAVLDHLADCEARMPTVIMGDLNEWSAHGGCLAAFARDHDIAHAGPSFHARRPFAALDRIIVSRDLAIVDAGVHRSHHAAMASDHLPIWARLAPAEETAA
ncbi:MAG: endonuclease/exonuclease/phosphatase family protein [Alphaproteobacteria bacterium]